MQNRSPALMLLLGLCNPALSQSVGFVAPRGDLPAGVIASTDFVTINATSPELVEKNLIAANGHDFRVNIDFSLLITRIADPKSLSNVYDDANGTPRRKIFEPTVSNKVRKFLDDGQVKSKLTPYLEVLARHRAHVGVLYLCDEPYVVGISRQQMESKARVVRRLLEEQKIGDVKLGITFASAMFDRRFAELINLQASRYAMNIDNYVTERMNAIIFHSVNPSDFTHWVKTIRKSRLATYDLAGNMYTGGGIPAGFDVVGFDFYLSTILLDMTHDRSLAWFAENNLDPSCAPFAEKSMLDVRKSLSFFGNTEHRSNRERQTADRRKLDTIYNCRMGAVLHLLKRNLGAHHPELLLISESSTNGVLDFDEKGNRRSNRSNGQAKARVLDEVKRAESFYLLHIHEFSAGLAFFPYEDAHDVSIQLKIGGASSMPEVMHSILKFSRSVRRLRSERKL